MKFILKYYLCYKAQVKISYIFYYTISRKEVLKYQVTMGELIAKGSFGPETHMQMKILAPNYFYS